MCPRNSHPKAILYSCCCEFLMHESVLEIVVFGTEYTTFKLKKIYNNNTPASLQDAWNVNWNLKEAEMDNSGCKESTWTAYFYKFPWVLEDLMFQGRSKEKMQNTVENK